MPLSAGTRLGPYEVLAPIGAGGMGEVYKARDTKLDRDVAIKVLPSALAQDPERLARFEREAKVLAALNHPNIAQIYSVEERALVMELVPGESLKGPLPLETALNYAKQIADALEAAHDKGIIHRDLKPANIMITPQGVVKVLDFGLAAVSSSTDSSDPVNSATLTISPTSAGMILGTAAYMSPEQARGKAVDKRADIWAFGVVLCEMLTGKQPFAGDTVSDTLAAVLRAEPDLTQVPAQAQRLLQRCLEKDRKKRLRDIGDALLLLEEEKPSGHPGRSLAPWAVAAVLAFALVLVSWIVWRAARPASQPLQRLSLETADFAVKQQSYPGSGIALSPDGTRIVYTGRGTDGTLYTRTLDQQDATPVAGTEGGYGPFFSPDGHSIGFFAGGKLKTISVEGGVAVSLCDAPFGFGGSWGEDDNIIAALNGGGSVLTRIPARGGIVQKLTDHRSNREVGHSWPQVLPGSQEVLFTVVPRVGTFEDATIEVLSPRTGRRKILLQGGYYARYASSGHLLYVHQGTLYAAPMDAKRLVLSGPSVPIIKDVAGTATNGFAHVDVSRSGTLVYLRKKAVRHSLQWLDSDGHLQQLRSTAAEYYGTIRFSPDGKRIALSVVQNGSTNLWIYDWERDAMSHLTFADFDNFPVWSPDGKHIAFASARHGGLENLYWMRADGAGDAVRLTESKNQQFPFLSGWQAARVLRNQREDGLGSLDAAFGRVGERSPDNW